MQKDNNEDTYESNQLNGLLAGLLFSAALLLGGLVGAATMLLLAPQSGKKTRAQIRRKGKDWRKQATGSVEDAVAQVRATANQTANSLQKQAEGLQQRGQDMLDRWSPAAEAVQAAVLNS